MESLVKGTNFSCKMSKSKAIMDNMVTTVGSTVLYN